MQTLASFNAKSTFEERSRTQSEDEENSTSEEPGEIP